VAELQACLLVLDTKIAGYGDHAQRINSHDTASPRGRRKQAGTR
jgi:hypothetical protein